jgi:multisubunit Na+/H+ antiporter MnhG subunit
MDLMISNGTIGILGVILAALGVILYLLVNISSYSFTLIIIIVAIVGIAIYVFMPHKMIEGVPEINP